MSLSNFDIDTSLLPKSYPHSLFQLHKVPKQITSAAMEKLQTICIKQGKKKTRIGMVGGGGGSVGGIVLWGGALIVAGFVAAFTVNKRRRRVDNEKRSSLQKEGQASIQGLRFFLQNSYPSFHSNSCCASNGSNAEVVAGQIDFCEINSTKSLILEENVASTINCRIGSEEILFVSESEEDGVRLCITRNGIEEFSLPMLQVENTSKNDLKELPLMEIIEVEEEELPSLEIIEGVKEEEAVESVNVSIEKTALMHVIGGGEDDGDEDEDEGVVKVALPSVESIRVDEDEEPIYTLKISGGKISSVQLMEEEEEEEGGHKEMAEELPSVEGAGVWKQEEGINGDSKESADITPLLRSVETGEDKETIMWIKEEAHSSASEMSADLSLPMHPVGVGGDEETVEESALTESVEVWVEDAVIGAFKLSGLTSSIRKVDKDSGKESLPVEGLETWKEEEASTSTDMASSLQKDEEAEDSDSKKDHQDEDEDDDEHKMEEDDENLDETDSGSAGSIADGMQSEELTEAFPMELKHNPQLSAWKIVDKGQTTRTEECNGCRDGKTNSLDNYRDNYQNTQTPMFMKNEETLKHIMVNGQQTVHSKSGVRIRYILVLALMVLMLFTNRNALGYLYS